MTKEDRLNKFLAEHPGYYAFRGVDRDDARTAQVKRLWRTKGEGYVRRNHYEVWKQIKTGLTKSKG